MNCCFPCNPALHQSLGKVLEESGDSYRNIIWKSSQLIDWDTQLGEQSAKLDTPTTEKLISTTDVSEGEGRLSSTKESCTAPSESSRNSSTSLSRISSIYLKTGLLQKSTFSILLRKTRWVPESIIVDLEGEVTTKGDITFDKSISDLVDEELNGRAVQSLVKDAGIPSELHPADSSNHIRYVLKRSRSNCGRDIYFAKNLREIRDFLVEFLSNEGGEQSRRVNETFVLQRYVPPLLIRDRKWHIRALVCVSGDPTTFGYSVYLHEKTVVILFAKSEYTSSISKSISSTATTAIQNVHLTNFCRSHTKATLIWEIEELGSNSMLSQMRECLADIFKIFSTKKLLFCPRPNEFEVFGFDFLIDVDGDLKVLEANSGPDFSMYQPEVVDGFVRDWVGLETAKLDSEIKSAPASRNFTQVFNQPSPPFGGTDIEECNKLFRTKIQSAGSLIKALGA